MIIDSHIHLISQEYREQLPEYLSEAEDLGVKAFINIGAGTGLDSAEESVKLAEKYSNVFAVVGIHPLEVSNKIELETIKDQVQHPKVVAIGETGLDYYYQKDNAKDQIKVFRQQIELAHEYKKPLVIHSRDAADVCLQILIEMEAKLVGGVFHCFSEDAAFAEKLADINFMVSFPGVITFKNADKTRTAVKEIPIKQIMLETDGPYLAPEPYRGKLCKPSYIAETAKRFAELRNLSTPESNKIIYNNTINFFRLPLKTI